MNRKLSMPIAAAFLAMFLPTAAQSAEVGDANAGLEFANSVCATCHSVDGKNTVSPKPEAPPFKTVASRSRTTRMSLNVWFRSPHPTMPNLILDRVDEDDVIAYILSLKD